MRTQDKDYQVPPTTVAYRTSYDSDSFEGSTMAPDTLTHSWEQLAKVTIGDSSCPVVATARPFRDAARTR